MLHREWFCLQQAVKAVTTLADKWRVQANMSAKHQVVQGHFYTGDVLIDETGKDDVGMATPILNNDS